MTSKLATRSKKIFQIMKKPAILAPLLVSVGIMLVGMCAALLVRPMPQSTTSPATSAYYVEQTSRKDPSTNTYARARVIDTSDQKITVLVLDGSYANTQHIIDLPLGASPPHKGGTIVVIDNYRGSMIIYQDVWRLPGLVLVATAFVVLAILVAGWVGGRSVLGLGISILIIFCGIIPAIVDGYSPILVTTVGSIIILSTSTLFSHGFRKRTLIALASIVITLLIAVLAMYIITSVLYIGDMTDDDLLTMQSSVHRLDMPQVVVASMIIIVLGLLDDVATAQVAVVDELRSVAKHLSPTELFVRAMSVGKEHVAALVNTISLTFVGASFPFTIAVVYGMRNDESIGSLGFNYIGLASEVVRTLVPSMALLLAVPLSTLMAVWLLPKVWRKKKKIRAS